MGQTKKEPSKKLQGAILNVVKGFRNISVSINQVFSIGREEGFNDMEIGSMVRKEMLSVGYDPRTIRRALPSTAKHNEFTRKGVTSNKEDKMSSSSESKNEVRAQNAQESDSNISIENLTKVRDSEFASNISDLPITEQDQKSVPRISRLDLSVTKQPLNIQTVGQPQQTLEGTKEDNTVSGLAKISILSEDSKMLKIELPIPKDIFWQGVDDYIYENYGQLWIKSVIDQETGKILSMSIGRNNISNLDSKNSNNTH